MNTSLTIKNANIVLPEHSISGSLQAQNGIITAIDEGTSTDGIDFDGDYLIPGLVELHTDHLEAHYAPRTGVKWNMTAAIQAHDAQIAASGITTVLDCLRVGTDVSSSYEPGEMRALGDAINKAGKQKRLRSRHYLHLRCEVSAPDTLDEFVTYNDDPNVRMASVMDHAPGQRQFQSLSVYERFYRARLGMDEHAFRQFVELRVGQSEQFSDKHRSTIAAACKQRNIALASHDDASVEHVLEAQHFGVAVAEFPTTHGAAAAAHQRGLRVLMGAPNVVRGVSHSGNLAANELADQGMLDILSSDYVPGSLIHAPFVLSLQQKRMSLPAALRMVTLNPAQAIGLDDRGQLATGCRADLLRVAYQDNVPVVKAVWRDGERVA